MSDIPMRIDGRDVVAAEGMTVLDAASRAGIHIPTLCNHEGLEPLGGCRICLVEAEVRGATRFVASCVHPAEENLVVRTRSPRIDGIRRSLLELLLAHAPDSPALVKLAREYVADRDRFEKEASFCVHCGLCVRYCAEVRKVGAVGFLDRGRRKEISFVPEIASRECDACKECFPLCPTSYLQATYVLSQALAWPGPPAGK